MSLPITVINHNQASRQREFITVCHDYLAGYRAALRNSSTTSTTYGTLNSNASLRREAYNLGIQHGLKKRRELEMTALLQNREPDLTTDLEAREISGILIKAGLIDPNWNQE